MFLVSLAWPARAGTAYPARENDMFLRMLRDECVALGAV